ncbi:MAG: hypothetical protein KDN22_20605 [Verrucomicrobiae bacterium]|nr:hypothetical protein [Verrucomicrobiae bacterium]
MTSASSTERKHEKSAIAALLGAYGNQVAWLATLWILVFFAFPVLRWGTELMICSSWVATVAGIAMSRRMRTEEVWIDEAHRNAVTGTWFYAGFTIVLAAVICGHVLSWVAPMFWRQIVESGPIFHREGILYGVFLDRFWETTAVLLVMGAYLSTYAFAQILPCQMAWLAPG